MQIPSCLVRRAVVLLAALFCCAATRPSMADISYRTQTRSISASATSAGSGTVSAPNTAPFDQSLRFESPAGWGNSAAAWQQSTLSPTRMDAQGGHSARGGIQASGGSASSTFEVTFFIDAPTPYALFGFWLADANASTLGDTAVNFTGPDGTIYYAGSRINSDHLIRSHDYSMAGTLARGSYRLTAYGRGSASGSTGSSATSFAVSLLLPPPAAPACDGAWQWAQAAWEPDGSVAALTLFDPDGPGGNEPRLLMGGSFTNAGGVEAHNIAMWDPMVQIWSPLGAGTNGTVRCLLSLTDGSLIAGGDFTVAGSTPANHIARWDGHQWTALGEGSSTSVYALTQRADGSVVASGTFSGAGSTSNVGSWDGTTWTPLGSGDLNGPVFALAVDVHGTLIAGGEFFFLEPSGNATVGVAAWDGTHWVAVGDYGSFVTYALAKAPNSEIISGELDGGVRRWNGTSWSTIERRSPYGTVFALAVDADGMIYAAGGEDLTQPCCGAPRYPVRRWNGTAWTALSSGMNNPIAALAVRPGGELVAGGAFTEAGQTSLDHLAQWDGTKWGAIVPGTGVDGPVNALTAVPASGGPRVIVGGNFRHSVDGDVNFIAQCTDGVLEPLGSGTNGDVLALAHLPGGDLIAAGFFTAAGGSPANSIARWDGSQWHPLGAGLDGGVQALAVLPNGDLIAGGAFSSSGGTPIGTGVARWDGTHWWSVGSGVNTGGYVRALAVMPNGDLIVGGSFTSAGGVPIGSGIARWDGTSWHALGDGLFTNAVVNAIAVLSDGSIVAAGSFSGAGEVATMSIARWDGVAWSAIGDGIGPGSDRTVNALAVVPSGELVVGGRFFSTGGLSTPYLATWDGNAWSGLTIPLNGPVHALAALPSGGVAVGGEFTRAGSIGLGNLGLYVAASAPVIIEQPQDQTACRGGITSLAMRSSGGTPRWQVELPPRGSEQWVWLADGVLPAATQSHASVTGSNTDTLAITAIDAAAALRYRATVTGGCGSVVSTALTLTFCPGDYNCDGGIDGSDVSAFFTDWEPGRAEADLTDDGGVDGADVEYFFVRWSNGC